METKLLYQIGNLFSGLPYAVKAELPFGNVEVHGPFSTENQANTYMHRLIEQGGSVYMSVEVVSIETPQVARRIVHNGTGYEYAV